MGRFNEGEPPGQQWIAYLDLSGGRNTRKDPHALDRNQLATSDNTWMAQGNTLGGRPGNISLPGVSCIVGGVISAGATGLGVSLKAMVEGRFFGQTALVVQGQNNQVAAVPLALPGVSAGTVNVWKNIGTVSGGTIYAAQLFDPDPSNANGPDGSLFITDGIDTPKYWTGPGGTLKPVLTANLPTKNDGSGNPITPKYVATLFSSLWYSGESTDPDMVYISDPWRPQSFTSNLIVPTGTITGSSYLGMPVGRGDGINGADVTGMAPLFGTMLIYKQSAIYASSQIGMLGDMVWTTQVLSASVGMTSPRSLVAFDQFHCILGIDGVYMVNLQGTTKLTTNNPDLFDGPAALIADRTTAIGVRYGNRYILFFDDGGGAGQVPLGYCDRGVWFDFDKLDADGLPCVGTFSAMNVAGVAPLRGPADTGNFAWANAIQDQIGVFAGATSGIIASSDFGTPITATVTGKADFFSDVWGDEAPLDAKVVDSVHLLLSLPIIAAGQNYTFNGQVFYDQLNSFLSTGVPTPLSFPAQSMVGSAIVGTSVVGILTAQPAFQGVPLFQPANTFGTIVQFSFSVSTIYPWTSLGYVLDINRQNRVGFQSG